MFGFGRSNRKPTNDSKTDAQRLLEPHIRQMVKLRDHHMEEAERLRTIARQNMAEAKSHNCIYLELNETLNRLINPHLYQFVEAQADAEQFALPLLDQAIMDMKIAVDDSTNELTPVEDVIVDSGSPAFKPTPEVENAIVDSGSPAFKPTPEVEDFLAQLPKPRATNAKRPRKATAAESAC